VKPAARVPERAAKNLERLLIVRLGSMGDIIHTLPAAAALRRAFPETMIGWAIEERWAELLCTAAEPRSGPRSARRPIVDKLHTVNTKEWRRSLFSLQTIEEMASGLSELRSQQYEVAVDFQVIYGFRQPRENVASMFYTREVSAAGAHVIEQNFSLAEAVAGQRLQLPKIEFPCDALAERKINDCLQSLNITDFILLNPGAGWGAKQWPAERYGEVAEALAETGLRSLINFGPGEDEQARSVEAASDGAALQIKCSLAELIALTRRARLFIGGDTGPMHLAAALKIPIVAIFGPTDPARNGPFDTRSVVRRSPLSKTSLSHRAETDAGLLEIDSDQVVTAARRLLEETRG
jgi:heptosyltransferase I